MLSAAAFGVERVSQQIKQNLRWTVLAAAHAGRARSWFDTLDTPEFAKYRDANPRLAFRPLRPYMSTRWTIARRVEVILGTYRVAEREGGALREALLRPEPVPVGRFTLRDGGDAELFLGMDERYRKEGEITLSAHCAALGGLLMSLAFSMEDGLGGRRICYVGCVQGRGGSASSMKAATKAMHGLRPRALMVAAIQEIARSANCTTLRGASDRIQVHHKKHLIDIPFFHSLSASYDACWRDAGGRLAGDGWYELPLRPSRRAMSEISSNKRSQYVRRYEMLDELASSLERGMRITRMS
jgi:uncharacterized protein VirK/YbjX